MSARNTNFAVFPALLEPARAAAAQVVAGEARAPVPGHPGLVVVRPTPQSPPAFFELEHEGERFLVIDED